MHLSTAVCTLATILLSVSLTEAKNKREKGWRKHVHDTCKEKYTFAVAIGGEINSNMNRLVDHANDNNKKIKSGEKTGDDLKMMTIFINGKDLIKPRKRSNRKRNRKFVRKNASNHVFGVVPWEMSLRNLRRMRTKDIVKQYKKSAMAIGKQIKGIPRFAHVNRRLLTKSLTKAMSKAGFVIVSNTESMDKRRENKLFDKKSFIYLEAAPTSAQVGRAFKKPVEAGFTNVSMVQCLKESAYIKIE